MQKKIVVGNWKMAPIYQREAKSTFSAIKKTGSLLRNVQTVIAPPFVHLSTLKGLLAGHRVALGGQDLFWEKEGAHTGEVSGAMLVDYKASYVIIGHSEKRERGETDVDVAKKVKSALKEGLTPIVCVGERVRDDGGTYIRLIRKQVQAIFSSISARNADKVILAYEPIWAIGKDAKREATTEDITETAIYIRRILIDLVGKAPATRIQLLYGGSVNDKNVSDYIEKCDIAGFLVGRASLKPPVFSRILHSVDKA